VSIKTKQLKINGMHCLGCEDIITEAVKTLPGIRQANASYRQQMINVEYDSVLVDETRICQTIEAKGYGVGKVPTLLADNVRGTLAFWFLLLLVGGVALWGKSQMPGVIQQIQPQMGTAVVFGIGFLTGFHCIGMCGGFVVGYTDVSRSKVRQVLAHLVYGFGKTLSYAILGAGFGLLGAAIAITPQIRGVAALAASVFLLLYGLKMLNVFDMLRHFTLRLPMAVNKSITGSLRKHRSPLLTGLLTGLLLGCGPLQAMYVMAAGSGDPLEGAILLSMFSLGTLLPLLGFGLFASLLSPAVMRQLVRVSGLLVIVMGLMMANRGLKMLESIQASSTMTPHFQQLPR